MKKRSDGRYLTPLLAPEGTRYACLFTNAEGSPVAMNDRHSCTYGELVGQIHDCLDERDVDERRFHLDLGHLIDEPLQHIEPFLAQRKKDFDYLKRVGEELKGRIEALLTKIKPLYGNCHGDHHGGNLCIDKNGRMTLFDFDCYGYGWRAYDVAVFLWSQHTSFGWSKTGKARATRRWHAFLRGYGNTRTLTQPEVAATKVFVPIRHI